LFSPELPVDQVLKIGRDFQNQDSWHGAHYDTARLLCDTIERLNGELKRKRETSKDITSAIEELIQMTCSLCKYKSCDGKGDCSGIDNARKALAELKGE
jgi:hypothetical protein